MLIPFNNMKSSWDDIRVEFKQPEYNLINRGKFQRVFDQGKRNLVRGSGEFDELS